MVSRNVRATHSEHLRDKEVMQEYLNEALESGDFKVLYMALRNLAEAQEGGLAGLAERADMGRTSLYKMLSSTGSPKFESFMKVIGGLGLSLNVGIPRL